MTNIHGANADALAGSAETFMLARSLAKRYSSWRGRSPECDYDTLFMVCLEAACLASQIFNPSRGVPWTAYATRRMKAELLRHIEVNTRGPRLVRPGEKKWDFGVVQDPMEELIEQSHKRDAVTQMLRLLTPRYREVLMMRFFEGATLEEVAQRLKFTKERARQIESKALETLRADQIRKQVRAGGAA